MAHAGTRSTHLLTDPLSLTAVGQACDSLSVKSQVNHCCTDDVCRASLARRYKNVLLDAMFLLSKNCGSPYIQISVLEQTTLVSPCACEGSLSIYSRILKL